MPCRSPGPHPGGRLRGLAGGSPGPHPGGKLGGLAWEGGLQAHTQGGIPPCTEEDTPPPIHTHMATAVGSTHPTGMHSCLLIFFPSSLIFSLFLPLRLL